MRLASLPAAPRPISFAAPVQYPAGTFPTALAMADFDTDGHLDVVAADYGPWQHLGAGVSVLRGNGDGTLAPRTRLIPGFTVTPRAIATADFNADGKADFVVGDFDGSHISVFLGDGLGGFTRADFSAVHFGAMWIATGDLDGDGRTDIAMANHISSSVSIYLNRTSPGANAASFTRADIPSGGLNASTVATGDLDGDGKLDLVISNGNNVVGRRGDGNGTFGAVFPILPYGAAANSLRDLDGDGALDLVAGTSAGIVIRAGNGDGTFGAPNTFAVGPSSPVSRPLLADLNADGDLDVAVGHVSGGLMVLAGHGDGTFGAPTSHPTGGYPNALTAGDLDGDGRSDVIATAHITNMLSVLINRTVLDSTPPVTIAALAGPAGNWGWYRGPVTVTLTAQDDTGVAATHYSVDGEAAQTYSGPFAVGEGVHSLSYWSADLAGNVEAARSLSIKVDSQAPAVVAMTDVSVLWPPNGKLVPVTLTGTVADAGSGPHAAAFSVAGEYGSDQPGSAVALGSDGSFRATLALAASRLGTDWDGRTYTIEVSAADAAGNASTAVAIVRVLHDRR